MSTPVRLPGDRTAVAAFATGLDTVPAAVAALGLGAPRPVLVLVGGAGGLTDSTPVDAALTHVIVPAVRAHDAIAVDGGTDSGVMRLLGRASGSFPLVGVATLDTVTYPGHEHTPIADAAPLEPHHTHFVLAREGHAWGDEAPYLAAVASALAAGRPTVTILANGGELTLSDAEHSLAEGRPLLILAGTGRAADRIAAAANLADQRPAATTHPADQRRPATTHPADDSNERATAATHSADERAAAIARSPLVHIADVNDHRGLAATLDALLSGQSR